MITKRQRVDALIYAARTGKLGAHTLRGTKSTQPACVYEDSNGRRCAVGFFLTAEQITKLREASVLNGTVLEAARVLGDEFWERVYPFTSYDLDFIQHVHDQNVPEGRIDLFVTKLNRKFPI